MRAVAKSGHFRLGKWLVLPQECRLRDGGTSHTIEPKLMDVLVFLCERAGEVVSVEELLIALWRGSFYGDNPVHKSMAQLRRVLGDSATEPLYIATIRKRGYQVVAEVSFPSDYAIAPAPAPAWTDGNPYPGLAAFEADHQTVFFGRSQAQAGVLSCLQSGLEHKRGFVLVLGPSGSGKTSLLQAGIVPLLTKPHGFDGLRAIGVGRVESLHIAENSAQALLRALLQWRVDGEVVFYPSETDWIMSSLSKDMPALVESFCDRWRRRTESSSQPRPVLLLVLDQLERAFTQTAACLPAMDWLFDRLSQLLATGAVAVLAACRNDFYPELVRVPSLAALKAESGQFDLAPLSHGEIAQIIRAPARAAGLTFEQDAQSGLRLDDVLRDAAIRHPQSLPLLQHCLSLLYERRSPSGVLNFAAYRELGEFDGALAQQAEQAFGLLVPAVRNRLPPLLRKMVAIDEDERSPVGRPVPWGQIDDEDEWTLAQTMVDHRLFASVLLAGTPAFSAAHESLFRQWPRIRHWIDENQRLLLVRSRVAQAARRWAAESEKRDFLLPAGSQLDDAWRLVSDSALPIAPHERRFVELSHRRARMQRRLRVAAISTVVMFGTVAGVSAIVAAKQRREAMEQRSQAESLVEFMLGKLTDSLRPLGKLDVLDVVSNEAMHYLSTVPQASANLQVEMMRERALREIGEIRLDRGDTAGATASFERARALSQSITRAHPDNADGWLDYGNAMFWLGQISYQANQYADAAQQWNGYLNASRTLNQLRPHDAKAMVEVSYAYNNLATLAFRQGHYAQAREQFTQSFDLKQDALELTPHDADIQADTADTLSWLGTTDEASGDMAAAVTAYTQTMSKLDALRHAFPDDQRWRYRDAIAATHLGDMLFAQGRLPEAQTAYRYASTALHALCAADTENKTWARDADYAAMKLARAEWFMQQQGDATAQMAIVDTSVRQLSSSPQASLDDRRLQAQANLVDFEMGARTPDQAHQWLDQPIDTLGAIIARRKKPPTPAQAHLLAQLLIVRAGTEPDDAKHADVQHALTLLQLPSLPAQSNAIVDLKARALIEAGRESDARPLIEQLARQGYRSPDYLAFLPSAKKGKA